jgi:ferric-dicitrate binding protein FerR (iron transport regulator)
MKEAKLLSYFNGELSESDSQEVENWAALSKENERCLEQVYYTLFVARRSDAYDAADVENAINKFRGKVLLENVVASEGQKIKRNIHNNRWNKYAIVAAFFAGLVISAGVLLGIFGESSCYEVSTDPGQRAHVVLPDGTSVWLNSSTQLSYESGWLNSKRIANLDGEAYFEVKRSAHRPFVVNSKEVRTQVLGTKFNIRARANENKVVTTLLEGSVQIFCDKSDKIGKRLLPGQTIVVNTTDRSTNLYAYNHPEEVLLWIKGELRFSNERLDKIFGCLEKVYNVRFTFYDKKLKDERFTCQFHTDSSLDDILNTLSLTQHFSCKIDGDEIMIVPVQ